MILETSNVFTPAKLPTHTDVTRDDVTKDLNKWLRRGGFYVSVLGITKLGKTTLVKGCLKDLDYSIFLRGQSLAEGPRALWHKLAADLGIPSTKETGTVSGDKSTWKFFAKFSAMIPGFGGEAGTEAGGEHMTENHHSSSVPLDAETEVIKALEILTQAGKKIAIAIDDFHFVTDVEMRRQLIRALRPVTLAGVSVVLITLPSRNSDPAFSGTQIGGRHKDVQVPTWSTTDLAKIASQGFSALNLTVDQTTVNRMASESFGSPQLMQQLCLDLCEDENGVFYQNIMDAPLPLNPPADWDTFFKEVKDKDSADWLSTLGLGPKRKRNSRRKHLIAGGREVDGYQLILIAIRQLGVPVSVPFQDIKTQVGKILGFDATQVSVLALEQKVGHMHTLAHKVMNDEVSLQQDAPSGDDELFTAEELMLAGDVPQPVFEYTKSAAVPHVNVLDPLLAYTLKWHEDSFMG